MASFWPGRHHISCQKQALWPSLSRLDYPATNAAACLGALVPTWRACSWPAQRYTAGAGPGLLPAPVRRGHAKADYAWAPQRLTHRRGTMLMVVPCVAAQRLPRARATATPGKAGGVLHTCDGRCTAGGVSCATFVQPSSHLAGSPWPNAALTSSLCHAASAPFCAARTLSLGRGVHTSVTALACAASGSAHMLCRPLPHRMPECVVSYCDCINHIPGMRCSIACTSSKMPSWS